MNSNFTVVMYHYVRDLQKSKYPNIKGLDIREFEEQILYLKKHYNIVSMNELIESFNNNYKLPEKAVLLTFDDGYIDHFKYVMPILDKYKAKGSFYIPGKTVLENKVLDVNKIHFILASQTNTSKIIEFLKIKLIKYKEEYNLKSFEYYYKKLAIANRFDDKNIIFIKRLLQVELDESLRNIITDELFRITLDTDEKEFSKKLYLNKDQITEMLSNDMHIGCHGYEHYWWNKLNKEKLTNDIDKSLDFLDSLNVDLNKWTACYPYGSYSDMAVEVLRTKGCKLAFTTEVDIAEINKNSLLIPRLDTNDLPKDRFSELNEWYHKG